MASWTTPSTANIGDIYTAAWYNQQTRDNLTYLKDRWVTGDLKVSAKSVDHASWLYCTPGGRNVSRTTYADLFALVGTGFGAGDGSTTFGLPDAGGRALVMRGSHVDVDNLGDSDGVAYANRTPKHNSTNSLTLPNHVHKYGGNDGGATAGSGHLKEGTGGYDTGNPTSNPAIGGSIGPGGTRPIDTPAFLVAGNLFIHF